MSMNNTFSEGYKALNDLQRQAVDAIDGPLLVIAGPGTGKTQLLSYRVANILKQGGVLPANILCLTFTDNAAQNMRDRLKSVIGQAAYHVAIHTFHSFGSELINQYPDFFSNRQMLQQIDELGRFELIRSIFDELPHSNPLSSKAGDDFTFLKDTMSIISWLKQNALSPDELKEILQRNQSVTDKLNDLTSECFKAQASPKLLNEYRQLLEALQNIEEQPLYGFDSYAVRIKSELLEAIEMTDPSGKYAPKITAWRNDWCEKNLNGQHVLRDSGRNLAKMKAVNEVYEQLMQKMADQALYDFDDMIIESVHAMENNLELLYDLQERYQFVMVDEVQDTNKAQLRILRALGNNPVNEGRPNIMAVGDDDQAIYAFQGAQASNMSAFLNLYPNAELITLTDNYRSTQTILNSSQTIANQITDRLKINNQPLLKYLTAKIKHSQDILVHDQFVSELAQYDFISQKIKDYIKSGIKPEEIAVIAPRHRYLERLMPYLGDLGVPVAYERRENILDSPIIVQLITMCRLITAISDNNQHDIDAYLLEVLSYDFWDYDPEDLLKLSIQAYEDHKHWLELLIHHPDKQLKAIAEWFMGLAKTAKLEPLEYLLDKLVGESSDLHDDEFDDLLLPKRRVSSFVSPMRNYYFNNSRYEQGTDSYLTLLGQLSTLRQRLRGFRPDRTLYVADFIDFVDLHRTANLKIIDTNPHTQTTKAVQVMTAYKAKGLEFDVVFLINAADEVWGPTARSASSRIRLPANLTIAPASDNLNDKLRLFFVSLTRAKSCLHITSYKSNLDNKPSQPLSFLFNETAEYLMPGFKPIDHDTPARERSAEILSTDWAYKFRQIVADKPTLFEPILKNYQLSVTHLNNFLDVTKDGPSFYLAHNLLRFPEALSPAAAYGDAIHKTLRYAHQELCRTEKLPKQSDINNHFTDFLNRKHLRASDQKRLEKRGTKALSDYFRERPGSLALTDKLERSFKNEGVVIGEAHLSGNIDKMHYISSSEISVIDFKTGKPSSSWSGKEDYEKLKLHKYRQQLLFYKLLVENSANFGGRLKVTSGALEFIEPDESGKLIDNLILHFDETEILQFKELIKAVWEHITDLNFPAVSQYPANHAGVLQFEADLINKAI